MHAVGKGKFLGRAARVAPGLVQFGHNVVERGQSHIGRAITLQVYLAACLGTAYKLLHGAACVRRHGRYEFVSLGVHGRIVERVVASCNSQETGTLLKGFLTEARHVEQLAAVGKRAVLRAVVHIIFCQNRAKPRHVGKQMRAGGVEVHADGIHAKLHGTVKRLFKRTLIHVVLILPHSNSLRVDFHELRQRVCQAAADRHRAAHRDIVVGKFLPRRLRSGIDRCAVLAHEEHGHILQMQVAHQFLGFAPRRTVADGNGLNFILLAKRTHLNRGTGILAAWRVGIDSFVVEQHAVAVEAHHFAARAVAGVDAHNALFAERGGEQELAQVFGKHADSLFVGLLLAQGGKLRFNRGAKQTLVGICHCHAHLFGGGRTGAYETALHTRATVIVVGRKNAYFKEALRLATQHGKHTVGRATAQRFLPIEIVAEFRALFFLAFNYFGAHYGRKLIRAAHRLTRLLVLVDVLGNDVARAAKRSLHIGHLVIEKLPRRSLGIIIRTVEKAVRQRLQTLLSGCLGAGFAFRFVGQIEVFEQVCVPTAGDALAQFGREFALLFNRVENIFPAMH